MLSGRNILVIGGTGSVGQIITRELASAFSNADIIVASRRAVAGKKGRVRFQPLDVGDSEALRAVLMQTALAVIATGPFDDFRASIHRACLDAHVNIVDINDSAAAATDIVALEQSAKTQGVRVLTGMGLAPGVSTLLLFKLMGISKTNGGDYQIRLYMGARNSGGSSNSRVLLHGFKRRLAALSQGKVVVERVAWFGSNTCFRFPGSQSTVRLLPFVSPECVTLPAFGGSSPFGIHSLDWRYHVQFLPAGLGWLLAQIRITHFPRALTVLAKYFHRSGQRMKQRADADETTSLVASPKNSTIHCAVHGPVSTSHLTATMAVAAVNHLLGEGQHLAPGIYPLERLFAVQPAAQANMTSWLNTRGILIENDCLSKNENDFRAIFGNSATFDGTAQSLRNYGKCWYSAAPIPPKVKAYQQACLRRSALWREVCNNTSWCVRITLMLRVRRRHRAFRRLAVQQDFGLCGTAALNAEIIKDFSLFAAGFSTAKELLGNKTLPLYTDMFLASSAMEMAWLWPSPRVFAAAVHRHAVLTDYVQAYVSDCNRLGIMRAHFERLDDGFEISVEHCVYAQILAALNCGELGGLVRDMEIRAISEMASACGMKTTWQTGEASGTGQLVVKSAQDTMQQIPVIQEYVP